LLCAIGLQALYDLTDVSEKEKLFMTMWNEYMRNHPIIAAVQLQPHLNSFVTTHSAAIFDNQLEDELIKHLTNMWVEGHIGRQDMLNNMKIYNVLVEGENYCST
jgi:VEFS-Box of polycomb protein